MTADEFRELALELPEAVESAHMDHPDFRVKGKIFATLSGGEEWGMVKLTPDEQTLFMRTDSNAFQAFPGAWGKRGCTRVVLAKADAASVRQALVAAWRNTAPKKLHELLE